MLPAEIVAETGKTAFRRWFDPRTKLALVLSITGLVNAGASLWLYLSIVLTIGCLFVFLGKPQAFFSFTLCFGALLSAELILLAVTSGGAVLMIALTFSILRQLFPYFMAGALLVNTTTVSELMAALGRMHVSIKIIIPLAVMLRFFPTVKEEWGAIREAMKMRGIGLGITKVLARPIKTIEYLLVPLLSVSVKIGEELSAAALSRGLGNPYRRTNACEIGFGVADWLVLALSVLFFVLIVV